MFENQDQAKDLAAMWRAMDEMPEAPACSAYPEAYFPSHDMPIQSEDVVWARKMCAECPLSRMCYEFAVKWDASGIWGGTTHDQRKKTRRQLQIQKGVLHPVPGLGD